jgi:uncharacterized protein (TIGR02265 family)
VETTIKGASLLARLDYVRERGGTLLLERVLERLAPEDRRTLDGNLLPSSRFPLALNSRLDEAIARALDAQNPVAVYRDLGRWSAEKNLKTMHAVYLKGSEPHQILERFPSVRATYYSDGTATYERTGPTRGVLRVSGASSHSLADCESTAGYFARAIELLGGDEVRVELVRCRSHGHALCELHCSWR